MAIQNSNMTNWKLSNNSQPSQSLTLPPLKFISQQSDNLKCVLPPIQSNQTLSTNQKSSSRSTIEKVLNISPSHQHIKRNTSICSNVSDIQQYINNDNNTKLDHSDSRDSIHNPNSTTANLSTFSRIPSSPIPEKDSQYLSSQKHQQSILQPSILQQPMSTHPTAPSPSSSHMIHHQIPSTQTLDVLQTSPVSIQQRSSDFSATAAPTHQIHQPFTYNHSPHYSSTPLALSITPYSTPYATYSPATVSNTPTTHFTTVAATPTNSWPNPMIMSTHPMPYPDATYRTNTYGTTWSYPQTANQPVNTVPRGPIKKTLATPRGLREVYACPFENCERVSTEHSNMKAHMRMHTGERPYVCRHTGCMKTFRWKSSLTYHERALHTKARPYKCGPCRKSFVEKRKLRMHYDLCPAVRQLGGMIPHESITEEKSNGQEQRKSTMLYSSSSASNCTGPGTSSIPHVLSSNSVNVSSKSTTHPK